MGWFGKVLRSAPQHAQTPPVPEPAPVPAAEWRARGNAALGRHDLAEAARCYEQGVLADAGDAALRLNLGFVLLELGKWQAASERLAQALALRQPADTFTHEAQYLLGRAQAGLGRPGPALEAFEAALRARPDFAEPLEEGVQLLHGLGRHAEAAQWARRLLALRGAGGTRYLLARELSLSGADAEAAQLLAQACAEEPADLDAGMLQFQVLMRLRRFEQALAQAQRLLEIAGANPATLVNAAVALHGLGRSDEALAQLDAALVLQPDYGDALVNRTSVLLAAGRLRECVAAAHHGLQHEPENAGIHWNLAFAHLLLGEFDAGWREHEWRFRMFPQAAMALDQPRWQGESLAGRSIFLYGEQGFGDNLQFVRYVPLVAHQAAHVYLLVPQRLEALMTGLPANCTLLPQGARLPRVDFQCPLMSVPAVLGTTEASIPAQVPYLRADPVRVAAWRERLPRDRLNVGIAWSGKPTYAHDHLRSMALEVFRAVAAPGCRFVTLQPELRENDRAELARWPEVVDAGRELRDFADTAALMEAVDLVVTTDTSVAHLAGALARPVWILLARAPDWRWMLEREDSPWYPTARLYRQGPSGSWPQVLARVQADLAALAGSR